MRLKPKILLRNMNACKFSNFFKISNFPGNCFKTVAQIGSQRTICLCRLLSNFLCGFDELQHFSFQHRQMIDYNPPY